MSVELLPLALALLATGAIAGVIAGLLGVGGGIVVVPVLFHVLPLMGVEESVRMHLAVGTSLAIIIPTSLMSARSHWKRGAVDVELLRRLGPWIFLGVVIGAILGGRASGDVLKVVFASVALVVALYMALRREGLSLREDLPPSPWRECLGLGIGGFSVVMGIGGGTLSVPILSLFGVAIRRAVATAAVIGVIIGVPGAVGFILAGWGNPALPAYSLGYANLLGVVLIAPTSMSLAPQGARLAHSIPPQVLRYAFSAFLLVTAVQMFLSLTD